MNNNKISIIIPCFNGYKYSEKCIDSIINQTYKNLEVIIIDDCSTDNSYSEFLNLSNKVNIDLIVLRNEKNMGPGFSRKRGVNEAKGDYICFCDVDDWLEDHFLEKMLNEIVKSNSDCVFCDYKYIFADGKTKATNWYEGLSESFSKKDLIVSSQGSLCITMTKKELLDNIEFPNIYHGEDAAVIPVIIKKSNKISICKYPLYNYVMRETSASNTFDRKAFDVSIVVFNFIKKNIGKDFPLECEYLGIKGILYSGCLNAIKCKIKKKEIKHYINKFESAYPNYINNPYLKETKFMKKIFVYLMKYHLFILAKVFAFLHTKYINR